MKKTKKGNHAVIALIVILLALAIGYASFSATLTINGTAIGTGKWDVHFKSVTYTDAEHTTATAVTPSKTVTDNDTATVNVSLAYPGDAAVITAEVINAGNIAANLTGITITDASDAAIPDDDPDFEVTKALSAGEILAANGGTCTATFVVKWKEGSKATSLSKTFKIKYDYAQSTTTKTTTPTHGEHTTTTV